jgi:protoporphyrinogen oxidase
LAACLMAAMLPSAPQKVEMAGYLLVPTERVPDSYPIYHKDYPRELDKARSALGQFSNLRLAGRTGLFWYNNMDHSMENAFQLTRRMLRDSGRPDLEELKLASGQA